MIQPQLAAFLQEGLSIQVGTRDATLAPHGARATAVTVEPGGTHLWVHVPAVAAPALLADLDANGHIAVAFGRPDDDSACQVKGTFVCARPAADTEHAAIMGQWSRLLASLEAVGLPGRLTTGWRIWPCVSIRMQVTAVFSQTPGPGAGALIA